ncbi:hypothetical protein [Collimonas humicola]|uniref:hypothetical protein n=1 Tax=Collimonas humicola TaxID=2825886 RepID=UPI001B8D14EE|nr:hypothetical protein [Collimonas humicola]
MRAQDLLPDQLDSREFNGAVVRKGTVGAFLANARMFLDPAASAADRQEAEVHMVEAIAALDALGVFTVLEIRDPTLRAFVVRHRR